MIFMRVGDNETHQVFFSRFQKRRIRQKDINSRITVPGESNATVDREPFALICIGIQIDAELFAAPERDKMRNFGIKIELLIIIVVFIMFNHFIHRLYTADKVNVPRADRNVFV